MLLDEQIVAIENAFVAAGIPHAFGGAQALAYYGSVRATHDIDVNVFVTSDQAERVLAVLGRLGARVEGEELRAQIARDGQTRVRWEGTPIDLFFSYDPLHQSSLERRRRVDFYGDFIHILSGEDLIVYKAAFDREKDWEDIAGMIYASPERLDYDYVRRYVAALDDEQGHRMAKLEALIASGGESLDD
jgi:hypothetical protein